MFPGDRWICPEPRRRGGLDRSHDRTDEGLESSILLRETISSPQNFGDSGKGSAARAFFLWRKGLLPRGFTRLGIVQGRLSDDKETGPHGRPRPALRVLLGCNAADEARCDARANEISSTGTDEKV